MKHKWYEIIEKRSQDRVYGFLKAQGKTIVNGKGEEILLTGWGLGNWLLNEGYMWSSFGNTRFDRPRRIESVIEELTGSDYQKKFFDEFRKHYFTEADIKALSELGYNSIRIPIHYRLLMEEEGIHFKESGFQLIDDCLDWCEKHKMYAFIDLHGAPGGQTGANIDDSIDDIPRLFIDRHSYDQCIALWQHIALRYKDRYIVGGYDLLNEPIRPGSDTIKSYDHLLPQLKKLYEDLVYEIRKIDQNHMFSIEGHHWSTSTQVFDRVYDPNMVIHFHRYGCNPDLNAYQEFLDLSEKWQLPLWLGETGENILEWFSAMYPLALDLNIGYNLWPAKKMNASNGPFSIKEPKHWYKVLSYLEGGPHPGYASARQIFDEYLNNIKLENCLLNTHVTDAVFRYPGSKLMGIDFDEFEGKGHSYLSKVMHRNATSHRSNTGMKLIKKERNHKRSTGFYNQWDHHALELSEGEFASYSFISPDANDGYDIELDYLSSGKIRIYENDKVLVEEEFSKASNQVLHVNQSSLIDPVRQIKIRVLHGSAAVSRIHFKKK